MTKPVIVKVFLASVVALVAGLVLLAVAGGLALAQGSFVMRGPDVVGFRAGPSDWVVITLGIVAVVLLLGAAIGHLVAWLGALISTAGLPDKTWFVILLVTGVLGVGLVAMIVYVAAGPEGPRPVAAPSPAYHATAP
jgi:hypothetical protein